MCATAGLQVKSKGALISDLTDTENCRFKKKKMNDSKATIDLQGNV